LPTPPKSSAEIEYMRDCDVFLVTVLAVIRISKSYFAGPVTLQIGLSKDTALVVAIGCRGYC
jgi:hypothetical protein